MTSPDSPEDGHSPLSAEQQALTATWEAHMRYEFTTRDVDATMATMVPDPVVNHVPVMTGGVGWEQVREFYATHFIPKMPPDLELVLISRTVGQDRLVDEIILRFTHTLTMDWLLPGVAPTSRHVRIPMVAIIEFRDGQVATERIYWDQASVLVQIGLLDPTSLPVTGEESAAKVLDPTLPANALMQRPRHAEPG